MAFRIPLVGGEAGSEDTFPRIYLLVDLTSRKALENLSPTGCRMNREADGLE